MDLGFSIDTVSLPVTGESLEVGLELGGWYDVWCYDKDGNLAWHDIAKNILPTINLNDVLNVYWGAVAPTTTWYIGMVDNAGFTAFAPTDTMASHAWSENTNTSLTGRPQWSPAAASAASISNTTPVTITMNPPTSCTIKGFFLVSVNTLGGNTGMLSAEAALTTPQLINNGDVIKLTYTLNATTS